MDGGGRGSSCVRSRSLGERIDSLTRLVNDFALVGGGLALNAPGTDEVTRLDVASVVDVHGRLISKLRALTPLPDRGLVARASLVSHGTIVAAAMQNVPYIYFYDLSSGTSRAVEMPFQGVREVEAIQNSPEILRRSEETGATFYASYASGAASVDGRMFVLLDLAHLTIVECDFAGRPQGVFRLGAQQSDIDGHESLAARVVDGQLQFAVVSTLASGDRFVRSFAGAK